MRSVNVVEITSNAQLEGAGTRSRGVFQIQLAMHRMENGSGHSY